MLCDICALKESKYTCPKCSSKYCSLACFKSEKHGEIDRKIEKQKLPEKIEKESETKNESGQEFSDDIQAAISDPMIAELVKDLQFQNYMQSPVLQFHILTVLEIVDNVSLTNEYSKDGRLEIASRKLNNLRTGGSEENEYVEEFVLWLLNWMVEFKNKSTKL